MGTGACGRSGDLELGSALTMICECLLLISVVAVAWGQTPSSLYKATGTVVSTEPTGFTLQTDAGVRLAVVIPGNALLLRVSPEEKTLKNATKISVADIAVGDHVLVHGQISSDQKTVVAVRVIDMSKAAIAQKHAAETAQWQQGVGGLVSAVDPVANTITISTSGFGGAKKTTVHVSKDTILRRYAPDSVKYEEAKPAPFSQIQLGDQLKARGTRSADGNDFDAQEIVSGMFLNIAGTVSSVDTTQNTLTVTDLKTKKPLVVKLTADSQQRKLDPQLAQRIAMAFKGGGNGRPGGTPGGAGTGAAAGASGGPAPQGAPTGGAPGGPGGQGGFGGPPGGPGGARAGGAPDFQRLLNRMATATLADLKKGDAVMIVASQGTDAGGVTAITLLSGVEPILTASPSASQALFSGSWSLGAPGGGGGEEGGP
ncbi:MAG: DUF5666 domain-containing protein [Terriglobia bacterium]|jgi:hypothetical protein